MKGMKSMKGIKGLKYLLAATLLAGVLATLPSLYAADAKGKAKGPEPAAVEKGKPERDWYPFGGVVGSVDKQANTIALKKKEGERVLKVDSKSTLEMNGKSVTIGSVRVGDYAHGKLHKDSAGKEVITDAKFDKEGPGTEKEPVEKAATPKTAPRTK